MNKAFNIVFDTIKNKGVGGGGYKTNLNGKNFELKTNNENILLENGYKKTFLNKYNYYLEKKLEDKSIVFVVQSNFKIFMKNKYNIDLFRYPDEAYIIESVNGNKTVKIIEKKNQNTNGSVETKLWSGPSLKREYELVLGDKFQVEYSFCLNTFLQSKVNSNTKKYSILKTILAEHNISILYGDEANYFEDANIWIQK